MLWQLGIWVRQKYRRGSKEIPITALIPPEHLEVAQSLKPWDLVEFTGRYWLARRKGDKESMPVFITTALKRIGSVEAPLGYR